MLLAALMVIVPQSPASQSVVADGGHRDLAKLLRADERTAPFVAKAKEHRVQVLLAEPRVAADGTITLARSHFGDAERYFYPASSIKLCGAIAALLKLDDSNRQNGTSLGLDSPWLIEPRFAGDRRIEADESNLATGKLTVRHALKKLFLVSDNQAYNHCIELLGQDGLNEAMWRAGFSSTRLWHRLSETRTLRENQQTRRTRVGETWFEAREAGVALDNSMYRDRQLGVGYFAGGKRVDGPMSFDRKNAIRLADLQDVLVEVVRPEIDTGKRGFPELGVAQRRFLVETLGQFPRESDNPRYDPKTHPDHACKFILPGVRKVIPAEHARVYDKLGRAYGFSTENAYVEDERTGRGFFLAIVIYTNPNGLLNDNRYAYEKLADPFLEAVGELVARAVLGAEAR